MIWNAPNDGWTISIGVRQETRPDPAGRPAGHDDLVRSCRAAWLQRRPRSGKEAPQGFDASATTF
jgi:hypothetical protein